MILLALNLKDIARQHPDIIPGNFELAFGRRWKISSGDDFSRALDTAYYRIERNGGKPKFADVS